MDALSNRHYAINWTDGMKVSRHHFVSQENFFISRLSESVSTQIHSFDYGLLPGPVINQFLNELQIDYLSTGDLEITVRKLDAITPGGYRVTIGYDEVTPEMRFTATIDGAARQDIIGGSEEAYYVILHVNPFDKKPAGMLNPDEIPHRHPHTMPAIRVSLLHESQFNAGFPGNYFIVIGRVARRSGAVIKDEQFIPPCTSMRSHPQLMRYYENIGVYINEIQQSALSIIQKIKSRTQQSDLSRNIRDFCEETVSYISQIYFRFRNVAFHLAPVYCIQDISSLAGRLYNTVQMLTEKDKEEMLKYFFEWCDLQPSQLEAILTGAIELKYEHTKAGAHLQQLDEMLKALAHIFLRLNRLEYIGIHKENIVVKEEIITQTIKTKKGWSLLD